MFGPPGEASELDVLASPQNTVEDDLGEVPIVQDEPPVAEAFVGGEDHGFSVEVAVVNDAKEDVGGAVRVVEVAD